MKFKLPHWPIPREKSRIEPFLKNITDILSALGNPQKKLPPVIHVAGTNGKGSTVAFTKSIFQAAGYRVHSYTSPHLIRYNERVSIHGEEISDDFLFEVIEETRIKCLEHNIEPTFFEGTTAAAFLAFSKIPADILVLETGMGGRFDATNVIEKPLMSILTSISYDHTEYLGNTLHDIALNKAGIIKQNQPCIVSQQYQESFNIIEHVATELNSPIYAFEYDWIVEKETQGFTYKSKMSNDIYLPEIGLVGDHQIINAGNAITAALIAKDFIISENDIKKGIKQAFWPARLQKLKDGPIFDQFGADWEIIVDGAHNESGAHIINLWLEQQDTIPTYLIFGMTKGRDVQKFISHLYKHVKSVMTVPIESEPLSYTAEEVSSKLNDIGINNTACHSIDDALTKILKLANSPSRILVCGSLYLAADVIYQNQKARK